MIRTAVSFCKAIRWLTKTVLIFILPLFTIRLLTAIPPAQPREVSVLSYVAWVAQRARLLARAQRCAWQHRPHVLPRASGPTSAKCRRRAALLLPPQPARNAPTFPSIKSREPAGAEEQRGKPFANKRRELSLRRRPHKSFG